jgi:hypothetical protein
MQSTDPDSANPDQRPNTYGLRKTLLYDPPSSAEKKQSEDKSILGGFQFRPPMFSDILYGVYRAVVDQRSLPVGSKAGSSFR